MKKVTLFMLAVVILISNFTLPVKAAVINDEEEKVETCRVIIHPITFDQYTDAVFSTILEAKKYFGMGRTYHETNEYYANMYFNWFYYFADGTKQFFYVKYDDDVDVTSQEEMYEK